MKYVLYLIWLSSIAATVIRNTSEIISTEIAHSEYICEIKQNAKIILIHIEDILKTLHEETAVDILKKQTWYFLNNIQSFRESVSYGATSKSEGFQLLWKGINDNLITNISNIGDKLPFKKHSIVQLHNQFIELVLTLFRISNKIGVSAEQYTGDTKKEIEGYSERAIEFSSLAIYNLCAKLEKAYDNQASESTVTNQTDAKK